ncbi:hypothetical protein, partial [Klebsiella michiganensis]|uniref:hypothetical protein n=1 Tax=Klebsiella michiganensis TaxID=1134687 RepID=UPI001BD6A289
GALFLSILHLLQQIHPHPLILFLLLICCFTSLFFFDGLLFIRVQETDPAGLLNECPTFCYYRQKNRGH